MANKFFVCTYCMVKVEVFDSYTYMYIYWVWNVLWGMRWRNCLLIKPGSIENIGWKIKLKVKTTNKIE